MALDTRLITTWRSREASARSRGGMSSKRPVVRSMPFEAARGPSSSTTSSISRLRLNSSSSISSLPASMREKSRMSSITRRSEEADELTVSR